MEFFDKREYKQFRVKVGDLVVCHDSAYLIIETIGTSDFGFNYHALDVSTLRVEDSFNDLEKAISLIHKFDDVQYVIPGEQLKLIAE